MHTKKSAHHPLIKEINMSNDDTCFSISISGLCLEAFHVIKISLNNYLFTSLRDKSFHCIKTITTNQCSSVCVLELGLWSRSPSTLGTLMMDSAPAYVTLKYMRWFKSLDRLQWSWEDQKHRYHLWACQVIKLLNWFNLLTNGFSMELALI